MHSISRAIYNTRKLIARSNREEIGDGKKKIRGKRSTLKSESSRDICEKINRPQIRKKQTDARLIFCSFHGKKSILFDIFVMSPNVTICSNFPESSLGNTRV